MHHGQTAGGVKDQIDHLGFEWDHNKLSPMWPHIA